MTWRVNIERDTNENFDIHLNGDVHAVIPTPAEFEILRKVEAKELLCPRCETPLGGSFEHEEGVYAGVILQCSSCL